MKQCDEEVREGAMICRGWLMRLPVVGMYKEGLDADYGRSVVLDQSVKQRPVTGELGVAFMQM
jgi:hypothetical protein